MNRRVFTKDIIKTVGYYTLFSSLVNYDLVAKSIQPIFENWLKLLNEVSQDLKQGGIKPEQWQLQVEELFKSVTLEEVINRIDFEKLVVNFNYPDKGVNTKPVKFPSLQIENKPLYFYSKLFGMKKDRAVIPHGHLNMASCHYVVNVFSSLATAGLTFVLKRWSL